MSAPLPGNCRRVSLAAAAQAKCRPVDHFGWSVMLKLEREVSRLPSLSELMASPIPPALVLMTYYPDVNNGQKRDSRVDHAQSNQMRSQQITAEVIKQ